MINRPAETFSAETVAALREVLNIAVGQISEQNRTPATKAKMAETIVRRAAEGVTDAVDLVTFAVREGETPAA